MTVPLGVILGCVYRPVYAVGCLLAAPIAVIYAVSGVLLPWNELVFYTARKYSPCYWLSLCLATNLPPSSSEGLNDCFLLSGERRVQLGELWLFEEVRDREEVADDVAVGSV
ncbi:MAG: hypothetical protein V5A56_08170 [Halolamina sp.]